MCWSSQKNFYIVQLNHFSLTCLPLNEYNIDKQHYIFILHCCLKKTKEKEQTICFCSLFFVLWYFFSVFFFIALQVCFRLLVSLWFLPRLSRSTYDVPFLGFFPNLLIFFDLWYTFGFFRLSQWTHKMYL